MDRLNFCPSSIRFRYLILEILGIELQIAEANDIPIILCFRDYGGNMAAPVIYENPDHSRHNLQIGEGYISLMALGIPSVFEVLRYYSSEDGVKKIIATLERLR